MKRLFFYATIFLLLCSSAMALNRVVIIPDNSITLSVPTTSQGIKSSDQSVVCIGHIKQLSILTTNHMALIDSKGNQYPLVIGNDSLVYTADKITEATIAFEIDKRLLNESFTLIWDSNNVQSQNKLIDNITVSPQTNIIGFKTQQSSEYQSSVIIEINSKQQFYQLWYLFPLLVIGLLALLKLRKGKEY